MERAVPNLPVDDLQIAKGFYVGKLGFHVRYEATEDGRSGVMGVERGGFVLHLDAPMSGHGRHVVATLEVDDTDARRPLVVFYRATEDSRSGRWDRAEEHFETSLQELQTIKNKIAEPETRRWYAWMLLDRRKTGDQARAQQLLREAIELYEVIGMPKHIELAHGLLERV